MRYIVTNYLENSSLHGAKYIVDKRNSLFEKIFWIICVGAAWAFSVYAMRSSLNAYWFSAISFVVETSYKDWNTNFMAIFICETNNAENIQKIRERLWEDNENYVIEEILNEIGYFRGEAFHTVHECRDNGSSCISSNYAYYANLLRSTCEHTVNECTWNDKYFNCCDYFMPVDTELGTCYAFNSRHARPINKPKLNLISNLETGPAKMAFNILTVGTIYVLGEEDVPNLISDKSASLSITPYFHIQLFYSVKNVKNDPETRSLSISQRNCRFGDENPLEVHAFYSYNACILQCRKEKQLKMCNCTSHVMPNTNSDIHCNITGLECLNKYNDELNKLVAKWSTDRKGIICDCLPSCTDVEVEFVRQSIIAKHNENRGDISSIEVGLDHLPRERYKRNVVHGSLDLVVSVGGIAGLFAGASILSFVEIIYYFCIRPFKK